MEQRSRPHGLMTRWVSTPPLEALQQPNAVDGPGGSRDGDNQPLKA